MLSLNREKCNLLVKIHYLLAHYIVTFRSLIVTHKKPSCASHVKRSNIPRQSLRHKQVSASGFPRHPLLSNVYVTEITTPGVTHTRNIIRDSVQSSAGLLKSPIFRYFQEICLKSYNNEHNISYYVYYKVANM